ncbi:hypothetical protein DFQ30_001547, partial [Apophysomyces sp. BC1015]
FQRHVPFPLGLKWRDVDDDPTARVRRLAQAHGQHVARNAKVLNRARERKRVRRDDTHVALEIDKGFLIEILRIDNRRVDVREDLEFVRTADIVAVAGRAVADDLVAIRRNAHLIRREWLDQLVLLGHAPDPFIGFDRHTRRTALLIAARRSFSNNAAAERRAGVSRRKRIIVLRVAVHEQRAADHRAHAVQRYVRRHDEAGGHAIRIRAQVHQIALEPRALLQSHGPGAEHAACRAWRVTIAAFVDLQRMIAVRRQPAEVVGHLHAVGMLDQRDCATRGVAGHRHDLDVGALLVAAEDRRTTGQHHAGREQHDRHAGKTPSQSGFH